MTEYFDAKEDLKIRNMIDWFLRFKIKEECPMCQHVRKFQQKLGRIVTEVNWNKIYEDREHSQFACFCEFARNYQIYDEKRENWPTFEESFQLANKAFQKMLDIIKERAEWDEKLGR